MANCLTRSFILHKTFFMYNKTSPSKFLSFLSPIHDKVRTVLSFLDIFSDNEQSKVLKNLLVQIHDFTGLSWWGTIISTSVAMRLFIGLPCGVGQQHVLARIELTKIELEGAAEEIKKKILQKAEKEKWSKEKLKQQLSYEMVKQWRTLTVKNNCHPFKNYILAFTQIPIWLLLTFSIRAFATDVAAMKLEHPMAQLQFLVGGPFWCKNLAAPDPTYILPALSALAILFTSELHCLQTDLKLKDKKRSVLNRVIIPNFLRLFAMLLFFVSATLPSGLSLFWTSSFMISVLQNLLLMSPRARRILKIPATPSDLSKPYSQIWSAFLKKWEKLLSRK